jgi:hypothetical protein
MGKKLILCNSFIPNNIESIMLLKEKKAINYMVKKQKMEFWK